jgi:hypothetical protein
MAMTGNASAIKTMMTMKSIAAPALAMQPILAEFSVPREWRQNMVPILLRAC